jgi:hypothetical protein
MSESYSWPEGQLWMWTGNAQSSANTVLAYVEDSQVRFDYGWDSYRTLDGTYHNNHTGQRVEIRATRLFTPLVSALLAMADSKTGVHMHFRYQNSANSGSAGHLIYSGRIDRVQVNGREGELYRVALAYHANAWSAYY